MQSHEQQRISEFGSFGDSRPEQSVVTSDYVSIDFDRAEKLDVEGSTCDTYLYRRYQKLHFIKRLKEPLRDKPVNRAALAKEFELGYRLSHPSLPVYRERGEDFIVMDYVEGSSVAQLIAGRDALLDDLRLLRKLLGQLVDVVDYLHFNNVTHCDIKPDNVMITLRNHNAVLLDLDKAYVDWHPSTYGAPQNYGVASDEVGSPDIDFHGIGRLIDRIGEAGYDVRPFRHFRTLCDKDGVTVEELRKALEQKRVMAYKGIVGSLILLGAGIAIGLVVQHAGHPSAQSPAEPPSTVEETIEQPSDSSVLTPNVAVVPQPVAEKAENEKPQPLDMSGRPVDSQFQQSVNKEAEKNFRPLIKRMYQLEKDALNTELSDSAVRSDYIRVVEIYSDIYFRTTDVLHSKYPDIPHIDIELAVGRSPAFGEYSESIRNLNTLLSRRL